jgi:hypothetical protein
MQFSPRIAAAGFLAATLVTPTLAQSFCTAETDGTFTPDFAVTPSMVVHSDGVLDLTRGELGLDGDVNERAFSFGRTIASILQSVGGSADATGQEAFVKTMLDSFVPGQTFPLNAQGGVRMPLDARGEAAELTAAALLDETDPHGMKPLALFNRFDLAPDNWAHCGEHRIVYAHEPDSEGDRFLLIFEAVVPNPNPSAGKEGCRAIAEFWAGLSATGLSDTDVAERLSAFYYDGKTAPDLATPDLLTPVVDYHNYGGDGGRGQVRVNTFNPPESWQLREWLTQRTFSPDPTMPPLAFTPVTVKNNPLAELYRDDLVGTEFIANNPAASANLLHGQFLQALTNTIGPNLLSENSPQHQLLVQELELYHLGSAPVTDDTVLLNTIGLGSDGKFDEFQSVSQGLEDAPGANGNSALVTQMLDQIGGASTLFVGPQTGEIILNRARASSCGGCHQTAPRSSGFGLPGVTVLQRADGSVLQWPDIAPGFFVHVTEARVLSPTLNEAFLPFRRYVLSRFLCEVLGTPTTPEPTPPVDTYDPYGDMPQAQTVAAAVGADLVDEAGSGSYFVDDLVAEFVTGAGISQPVAAAADVAEQSRRVNAAISELTPEQLAALRLRVNEAITLARNIELQRAGAFVETRRPH